MKNLTTAYHKEIQFSSKSKGNTCASQWASQSQHTTVLKLLVWFSIQTMLTLLCMFFSANHLKKYGAKIILLFQTIHCFHVTGQIILYIS